MTEAEHRQMAAVCVASARMAKAGSLLREMNLAEARKHVGIANGIAFCAKPGGR